MLCRCSVCVDPTRSPPCVDYKSWRWEGHWGGGCRGGVVGEQKARAMMAPARAVMMVDAASCDDADDSNDSLLC